MQSIKFEDIQDNPNLQKWKFFYVIHGVIPEVMPSAAYRRVGTATQHRRKILKCPFCASRLSDMDSGTSVELYGHETSVAVKCQLYIRCSRCRKEVGINLS